MLSKKLQLVVDFRFPTNEDIENLCLNMRQSDIDELNELNALNNKSIRQVVIESVNASDRRYCVAVIADGELACIFGLVPHNILSNSGICWMLGTGILDNHKIKLTKTTMRIIDLMMEDYSRLFNVITSSSTDTIRWLKLMKFKFYGPIDFKGVEIQYFERRSQHV